MENAEWLSRSLVDRHGRDNACCRELDDVDAQSVGETAGCEAPKIGKEGDGSGGVGHLSIVESSMDRCVF